MIRLNKFLAQAGIASRRFCDDLIKAGHVKVNGEVVHEMGIRIDEEKDEIVYKGRPVRIIDDMVYILMNKPGNVVTTSDDELGRRTVIDLLTIRERVYPVGRLDYETTGVLLLTNDGTLTNALLHPSKKVEKIYHVLLDKMLRPIDHHHLQRGVELDGKMTQPCQIRQIRVIDNQSYLEMRLREGRNRQIRRMFDKFGYQVEELDRVSFAGLTATGLKRGEWRPLKPDELSRLKREVENED